jgi:serine/threonine protein kinase
MNNEKLQMIMQFENPKRYLPNNGDWIDQYQVISTIGEGTFGVVFKVKTVTNKFFALKMIKLWEIAYEKEKKMLLKRFGREYEVSRVESNFIIRSEDCGKIEGNPYLVMELCVSSIDVYKGSFGARLDANKLAYQILCGLEDLHNRSYFHRDIKPQNILLTSNGDAKITDFGIAGHKTARLTETNLWQSRANFWHVCLHRSRTSQ